ncbi:hypothetical protein EVG20_g3537 [Dentipellis fragilis]|uniref:Uncharacterized protein n=1 Tax=Dentipellis fragilis TaxID=205917 RepID=A0A4Y9Z3B6_9AGAM|nr:hypothetical protein EVG20_g3537 [Dentipellis fragilis]
MSVSVSCPDRACIAHRARRSRRQSSPEPARPPSAPPPPATASVDAPTPRARNLRVNALHSSPPRKRRCNPRAHSVRLGLAFFLAAPGALIGAPINGYLLGDTFPWSKTILFSAIIILAGTVILTFGRILLARRKGTPFV